MQRGGNLGQDFGATMLLAGDFPEPGRLQQAAQLSGEDSRLGGEVFIKKLILGIM